MEGRPGRVKAYCPKCFMTFEGGKHSKRVSNHLQLKKCDEIACTKQGSECVRKFNSVNSANRHTYCYLPSQVKDWDEALQISLGEEETQIPSIEFSNLTIGDKEKLFPAQLGEGPPYKYSDLMKVEDLFTHVKRKMGEDFPGEKLDLLRMKYDEKGYTILGTIRDMKRDVGDWEFLFEEFRSLGRYVEGPSHVIKHMISKPKKKQCA